MVRLTRKSERGFTLVELLIVIAIIGVLSTIGIPAFKRMVQKSKKTEAKTNLGGVYTAEQAFFSEYGGYGNNLERVGFAVDGTKNNLIYNVGFFNTGCSGGAQATVLPDSTKTIGAAIKIAYPQYYTATYAGTVANTLYFVSAAYISQSTTASLNLKTCAPAVAFGGYTYKDGGTAATTLGVQSYAPGGGTSGDSNGYIAGAVGVVAANADKVSPATKDVDYWTIDHERNIVNVQDGVH